MNFKNSRYHFIAFFVMTLWGVTFVSSKILLFNGLTPEAIFFYRFTLAYIGIWFFGIGNQRQLKKRLLSETWRDEFLFLLLGIFGGSFYFLAENTALKYTFASNVALIVCTAPLLTVVLTHFMLKSETINSRTVTGFILALLGVALVVFNGQFILKLNPKGDILSFMAALCWAFYTIVLKRLGSRYNSLFITRKVFFYGLLTMSPMFLYRPLITNPEILFRPVVWSNLLFLGLIASLLCYFAWNVVVKHLGAVRSTIYIYLNPIAALIASSIIIHEKITGMALIGTALILIGMFWVEKGMPKYFSRILKKVKKTVCYSL